MREIKFRAWNKPLGEPGEMIDVTDLHFSPNIEGCIINDLPRQKQLTLMQYTGLKDKNGVEIYEGDIVAPSGIGGMPKYAVEWDSVKTGWIMNPGPTELHIHSNDEVIGNIYETPELVEAA